MKTQYFVGSSPTYKHVVYRFQKGQNRGGSTTRNGPGISNFWSRDEMTSLAIAVTQKKAEKIVGRKQLQALAARQRNTKQSLDN